MKGAIRGRKTTKRPAEATAAEAPEAASAPADPADLTKPIVLDPKLPEALLYVEGSKGSSTDPRCLATTKSYALQFSSRS